MASYATDIDQAAPAGKGQDYEVLLVSDDFGPGYAVFCPSLPGCGSQGDTREEALDMIADAISMYLDSFDGQEPPLRPDGMAQMVAEYEAGGCRTEKAVARITLTWWERTIMEGDAAISLNPEDAEAYYLRDNAYSRIGEYEPAIADYGAAVRLAPDCIAAYCGRGSVYLKMGDYDRAIADYTTVLGIDVDYIAAYGKRGDAYLHKVEYDHAINDYETVLFLNPGNEKASHSLNLARVGKQTVSMSV